MDNPAVSAPAVPGRQLSQQVNVGTGSDIKEQPPSPVAEPVTAGIRVPSKNDEGWRRVVRNFSPSCKPPEVWSDVADAPFVSPPHELSILI